MMWIVRFVTRGARPHGVAARRLRLPWPRQDRQTVTAEGDDKRGELVALCRDDHEIAERTLASDAIVEGAAYLWRSCQIAEALKFLTAFNEWSGGWSQRHRR